MEHPPAISAPPPDLDAAMQGAQALELAFVGVVNGLFAALDRHGRMDPLSLAEAAGVDRGYVVRWCEAAFAFGLLDLQGDTWGLTATGRRFLPAGEGTLLPAAVQLILSAHLAERAAGLMASGERPGERVLAERQTVLPWFGTMLEHSFGPLLESQILGRVPEFAETDARGGTVVDLGCGNGWYLRRLAAAYPRLRGIGLDGFEENIRQARETAAAAGLADRLEFRQGDIYEFAHHEPVAMIVMNRALHHVWADKARVLDLIAGHLEPGGAVVIWEPDWPLDPGRLADPGYRGMAFQNLAEHVQGNHFLHAGQIAEALESVGLEPRVHHFAEGREAVVVGRRPAR